VSKIHSAQRVFWCGSCLTSFDSANERDQHEQQQGCGSSDTTVEEDDPTNGEIARTDQECSKTDANLKCSTCGKSFQHLKGLMVHAIVHSTERPFSCNGCGRTFKQQMHLSRHRMACGNTKTVATTPAKKRRLSLPNSKVSGEGVVSPSNGQQQHDCTQCDKSFSSVGLLKLHGTRHSNERPHACHCGKTFKMAGHLASHMKRHQNEELSANNESPPSKAVPATALNGDASKTFQPMDATEYEEDRFACRLCGLGFANEIQLGQHVESHHTEADEPLSDALACPVCEETQDDLNALNRHLRAQHDGVNEAKV
jgi:KRAB domain-containing zinc finger protein